MGSYTCLVSCFVVVVFLFLFIFFLLFLFVFFFFLMIRRPPRSTQSRSSAASMCIRDRLIVALRDGTSAYSAAAAAVVIRVPSASKPVLLRRCPEQLARCQPILHWIIGEGAQHRSNLDHACQLLLYGTSWWIIVTVINSHFSCSAKA